MLSDHGALQLLAGAERQECACPECDAAHARGFQAGLWAAGEPWLAVFFGLAGFAAGVAFAVFYLSHG